MQSVMRLCQQHPRLVAVSRARRTVERGEWVHLDPKAKPTCAAQQLLVPKGQPSTGQGEPEQCCRAAACRGVRGRTVATSRRRLLQWPLTPLRYVGSRLPPSGVSRKACTQQRGVGHTIVHFALRSLSGFSRSVLSHARAWADGRTLVSVM